MDREIAQEWIDAAIRDGKLGGAREFVTLTMLRLHEGAHKHAPPDDYVTRGLDGVLAMARRRATDTAGWATLASGLMAPAEAGAAREWLLDATAKSAQAWHSLGAARDLAR